MLRKVLSRWREGRRRKMSARWLVRMHGPDAFRWRGHFEAWRQDDPENARTYDRQLRIWSAAPRLDAAEPVPALARPILPYAMAASVLAVAAGVIATALWSTRAAAPLQIVANGAGPRTVQLADGSDVVLARGSELQVAFDQRFRRLALTRGRMRLRLQHEQRPGLLRAGSALVRSAAASIDVSVGQGMTRVIVLDGELQLARYEEGEEAGVKLKPGELADVGNGSTPITPRRARPSDLNWSKSMISFDDAPLAEVLADANALSMTPIALADSALGVQRVTGAYLMGDNEGLARSLAASLDLSMATASDGAILLRRKPE
ncbi:hypothetical protein HJG53_13855 [Sphingomonas sp. ID1715]|uniref:FecR family protein n=1 Tax=Sphingomonas sp. ID1715 TaxID=1656898 RepID=UPI0017C07740|nr:FecR domain-containing protein [Sphingomonas sp. ID1715]NNM77988.1 hypothetical protein [Sphingomonas sp. ID1715]